MFSGVSVRRALADMFNLDKFPPESNELYVALYRTPNLLRQESRDSYTSALLAEGCLNCVDRIAGFPEADIFYCGETFAGLSELFFSAAINIYLALNNSQHLQYYFQRLHIVDSQDCQIHSGFSDISKPEDCDEVVAWFVEKASEIKALQADEIPENKIRLAKRYLIIAMMEDSKENASFYFYKKAAAYLKEVLPDCELPAFSFVLSETLRSVTDWKLKYADAESRIAEVFDRFNIQLSSISRVNGSDCESLNPVTIRQRKPLSTAAFTNRYFKQHSGVPVSKMPSSSIKHS